MITMPTTLRCAHKLFADVIRALIISGSLKKTELKLKARLQTSQADRVLPRMINAGLIVVALKEYRVTPAGVAYGHKFEELEG